MRRTSWFRSLAAGLALWFPLVVGEPSLLQPCPTHGAAVATVSHHGGAPASAHVGHGTASHGHDQAPTQQHQCTCIGCCAGSPAVALAPITPATAVTVATYDVSPHWPTAAVLPRPGPEFSHPFTTGPPRV